MNSVAIILFASMLSLQMEYCKSLDKPRYPCEFNCFAKFTCNVRAKGVFDHLEVNCVKLEACLHECAQTPVGIKFDCDDACNKASVNCRDKVEVVWVELKDPSKRGPSIENDIIKCLNTKQRCLNKCQLRYMKAISTHPKTTK